MKKIKELLTDGAFWLWVVWGVLIAILLGLLVTAFVLVLNGGITSNTVETNTCTTVTNMVHIIGGH